MPTRASSLCTAYSRSCPRSRSTATGGHDEPVPHALVPGGRRAADRLDAAEFLIERMQEVDQVHQFLIDVRGSVGSGAGLAAD